LQSGCDATLKRMNRHYTSGEYLQGVERLRKYFDNPAITTDVIVGFPGETEEEFELTKEFLNRVKFYEMHVFRYSKRQGTVAASMKEQVPESIKAERSNVLLHMEEEDSKEFRASYINEVEEVLFEETKVIDGKNYNIGHTTRYVKVAKLIEENTPEDKAELSNVLLKGRITGFLKDDLLLME